MILVTDYMRNDLDGVACVYAYSEFLKKKGVDAVGGIFGKPHAESRFVMDKFGIKIANAEKLIASSESIILVDASDLRGISPKIEPGKVIEIIDHRKLHDADKFPHAKVQIELVGSAATLIAEKFRQEKIPISRQSAAILACAIVSNTVNFKAGVTTMRDKAAFKWLNSKAKVSERFIHRMFVHKSQFNLRKELISGFASFTFGNSNIGMAQLEIVDAESFVRKNHAGIKKFLEQMKKSKDLDHVFLTCIDVEKVVNIFLSISADTERLISPILKIRFENGTAKRRGVIMRKEITPLLMERLK